MKILNIIIALLVVSIIISGGFLGYLMYTQNVTTPTETDTDNTDTTIDNNNNENNTATDGPCTDLFTQGNGLTNTLADIQLNFSHDSTAEPTVGDIVTVTSTVLTANPANEWKGLELKMIYPCDSMRFVKATPLGGDNFVIEVASEYDNIAEVHIATSKESFASGDQLVQFEFEITEEGPSSLEVADSSIVVNADAQEFSIATNKISLP